MITWMQRHKKYLVVTIWISTIAFVGAGFVGWGAYDFNSDRATAVAKVGDRKITVQDFQFTYSNYYNFYNNMLGGKLTKEQAEQMGLDKIVLQSLMQEAALLNYADELGLKALDSEVMQKLASDETFQDKGVFNKEIYYTTLKRMGIGANEYERGLKKQILLDKLNAALNLPATKSEIDMFKAAILMQDRLEVSSITLSKEDIKLTDKEIKDFWEQHKNDYMTTKSYNISYLNVLPTGISVNEDELKAYFEENKTKYTDKDGKLLDFEAAKEEVTKDFILKNIKKEALKSYLAFKKDEVKAEGSKTVFIDDKEFPVAKLQTASSGEILKPIEYNDGYIIIKIDAVNNPTPKAFEAAKPLVTKALFEEKYTSQLEKVAQARLTTFQGEDIGFVSRDSIEKILGLDEANSMDFINYVFSQKSKQGYKIVGQKALLYRVLEQKLLPNVQMDKYASLLKENVLKLKNAELNQNLIKKLGERYESEQYYKGK